MNCYSLLRVIGSVIIRIETILGLSDHTNYKDEFHIVEDVEINLHFLVQRILIT